MATLTDRRYISPTEDKRIVKRARRNSRGLEFFRETSPWIVFLLPLIFLPGLKQAFSTPKLVLLGFAVSAGLLSSILLKWIEMPRIPLGFEIGTFVWLLGLSLSAISGVFVSLPDFLLQLFPVGWCWLLLLWRPESRRLGLAITLSGTLVAAMALLQFCGVDFYSFLGWKAHSYSSPRMRVGATIGNPNYVAAFLLAVLPFSFCSNRAAVGRQGWPRWVWPSFLTVQCLGLVATGSRSVILGLFSVFVWLIFLGKNRVAWQFGSAGLLVAMLILSFSPARSVSTTLRGRVYTWKIPLPHLGEKLLGQGPGSFTRVFLVWESAYWQENHAAERENQFRGLEDHAHNDYLEILVERGFISLAGLFMVVGSWLVLVFKQRKRAHGELLIASSAGLVGLLASALVDFPLHRPTELVLFWTLAGISLIELMGDQKSAPGNRMQESI